MTFIFIIDMYIFVDLGITISFHWPYFFHNHIAYIISVFFMDVNNIYYTSISNISLITKITKDRYE
jgi:hypothetical protein